MSYLAATFLHVIHALYSLASTCRTLYKFLATPAPQPLRSTRRQLPQHLAVVLSTGDEEGDAREDDTLVESVCRAVQWCQEVGIPKLSVYDRHGVLHRLSSRIQATVMPSSVKPHAESDYNSDSDIEYPLTPPSSDSSESRSLTPDLDVKKLVSPVVTIHISEAYPSKAKLKTKERQLAVRRRRSKASESDSPFGSLSLSLLSYEASKPCMAAISRCLAYSHVSSCQSEAVQVSIERLDQLVQDTLGPSSPELMIIHALRSQGACNVPLELEGYPPWQMRLTEFHRTSSPASPWRLFWHSKSLVPLQEHSFRRALDEYAGAEMRLGK